MWYNLFFALLAIAFFFLWMRADKRFRNVAAFYKSAVNEKDIIRQDSHELEIRLTRSAVELGMRRRQVAWLWKKYFGHYPKWAVKDGVVRK